MPRFRFRTATLLAVPSLLLGGSLALADPIAAQNAVTPDAIDRVFRAYDVSDAPGCAVGVDRVGEPLLLRAYGVAELEHGAPNRPDTRFESGSVSKQFTAAAVVLLALDGELSLDDDIRTYFPEIPDYGTPITIRHLLNHTSGLRDWGSVAGIEGWPRTTRAHDHRHVLEIIARQQALNYAPGAYYSYTNSGYNLLAMLVERVSGETFADFSRTRIFEPLGLDATEWRDDFRRLVPGRAAAYAPIGGGGFRLDMPFEHVHGNGGLITTVEDLLMWTRALAEGTLGGPDFVREMHQQGLLTSGRPIAYASGLRIDRYRGVDEVQHSGATAGYRAFLTRLPDAGIAVAVLCNRADANAGSLTRDVLDVALGAPADEPERPAPTPLDARERARLEGRYADDRTGALARLSEREGGLVLNGQIPLVFDGDTYRAAGYRVVVVDAPEGGRPSLLRIDDEADTLRFAPVDDFDPSPEDLSAFEGRYHSPEAEVTYELEVRDGRLNLVNRWGLAHPVVPAYTDAFLAGGEVLRFERGPGGRVLAMHMGSSRVWNLVFRRLP